MQHRYYFFEVGPGTDPVLIGTLITDECLAGVEAGKDFILEQIPRSNPSGDNALRGSGKTKSIQYRIEEGLHGARISGGSDSTTEGAVTRMMLRHQKDLPEPA